MQQITPHRAFVDYNCVIEMITYGRSVDMNRVRHLLLHASSNSNWPILSMIYQPDWVLLEIIEIGAPPPPPQSQSIHFVWTRRPASKCPRPGHFPHNKPNEWYDNRRLGYIYYNFMIYLLFLCPTGSETKIHLKSYQQFQKKKNWDKRNMQLAEQRAYSHRKFYFHFFICIRCATSPPVTKLKNVRTYEYQCAPITAHSVCRGFFFYFQRF